MPFLFYIDLSNNVLIIKECYMKGLLFKRVFFLFFILLSQLLLQLSKFQSNLEKEKIEKKKTKMKKKKKEKWKKINHFYSPGALWDWKGSTRNGTIPFKSLSFSASLSLSMYGGSSKLGRGGGGGGSGRGTGAKRPHSSFPLPPPHRPSGPGPAPASRLSLGGRGSGSASNPRSRGSGPPAAPAAVEETFSLVAGNNPLAFAMIIRLAPDLVDEIRRVEAQDGTARVKFDANANNSAGNVSFLLKFQLGPASFVVICKIWLWLCLAFASFFFFKKIKKSLLGID